jgi:EF-P beta-lysylation protein EpmB
MSRGEGQRLLDGPESSWQKELAEAFRDGRALLDYLDISPAALRASGAAEQNFACLVPRPFARRMVKGDPLDPLLRQVFPDAAELAQPAGYQLDPLQEQQAAGAAGVLQKYPGRALLITTGACPVHCRYCFRRYFPYTDHQATQHDWQHAVTSIRARHGINEVILSGGDPLTLSNRRLAAGFKALCRLPQLRTIRLHTRFPIILPSRVDDALLQLLADSQARVVMVVHANHPNELDVDVMARLAALRQAGVTMLNQSVLLGGVNDCAATLAQLSERLFAAGVLPYYLHLLDPVAGAAHFNVDESRGIALVRALRARLPGYLVPRLAREIPGQPGKTVLA